MDNRKDLYKMLGAGRKATTDEINQAYKKLSLKYHPDRNPGAKQDEAAEKFKEVNEAHDILGDPELRKIYDKDGYDAAKFAEAEHIKKEKIKEEKIHREQDQAQKRKQEQEERQAKEKEREERLRAAQEKYGKPNERPNKDQRAPNPFANREKRTRESFTTFAKQEAQKRDEGRNQQHNLNKVFDDLKTAIQADDTENVKRNIEILYTQTAIPEAYVINVILRQNLFSISEGVIRFALSSGTIFTEATLYQIAQVVPFSPEVKSNLVCAILGKMYADYLEKKPVTLSYQALVNILPVIQYSDMAKFQTFSIYLATNPVEPYVQGLAQQYRVDIYRLNQPQQPPPDWSAPKP